jgi:hypothetical protein
MCDDLGRLRVTAKTGQERFRLNQKDIDVDLLTFWRWSASDLVDNTMRGILAEFIVAKALDLVGETPREAWAKFDLLTESGLKIEVKSAAYVQSWAQRELSRIAFRYGATRGWDPDTNKQGDLAIRHADLYVFALLSHREKRSIDPTNLDQWQFYLAATKAIAIRERSQHSINLKSLEAHCAAADPLWNGPVAYWDLKSAIMVMEEALSSHSAT